MGFIKKLIVIIAKKKYKEHFKVEENKGFEPLEAFNYLSALAKQHHKPLGQFSKMQKEQYNI